MISFTAKSENRIGAAAYPYQEEYVRINGISEYLLHCPASPEAPVILHIHGGPGAPASVFAHRVEAFARNYNIVYYDQRGAGKTLRRNPCASLSMDLLMQDLLETVLHLKRAYNKDKIGILGHSWGSVLGSAFAIEHPEHVFCYIGCGQMYCFRENEKRAYALLRDAVMQSGDEKAKRSLRRLAAYPMDKCSLGGLLSVTRMRSLQGRFGFAAAMDAQSRQILRSSPVTNVLDLLFFSFGCLRSAVLMKDFWNYDLRRLGHFYQMPVYYLIGSRDRTTPYEIAQEYFGHIKAPRKEWCFIPDAGHFAMLDNTKAWQQALYDTMCTMEKI